MNKGVFMNILNKKYIVIFLTSIFIISTALFMIFQVFASKNNEQALSQQQIIQEAKAHFQSIVDTRSWNSQFGGVYVKATESIKPNPYLKNNVIYTDKNETLIKINPAWMTRQISDISNKQNLYHYSITSLKPLNPTNIADKFETQALKYFENNKEEKYYYKFNDDLNKFNFMGALIAEESCLQCHAIQGYKVGDIRGGIRVSLPLKLHNQKMEILEEKTTNNILMISTVAILFLGMLIWIINLFYKRQYEVEYANEILEEKVEQRTYDLEIAISHEQHLKELLKITTEVNEMLITSFSTRSVLKNSTLKLATNKAYSLILTGLINDNILEVVSKSKTNKHILEDNFISLKNKDSFLVDAIQRAATLKQPVIENISDCIYNTNTRREDDLSLEWIIVLPLVHDIKNDVYGMITVFCSRKAGFEAEEIKILENMAHDISLALYSHKQRDAILKMEKEKSANYEETILAFVNIIEQRDSYTAGHTIRVAEYCALIAKKMGYTGEDISRLEKAAILHDIGKVATPDTILLKPGILSHLEFELIKQHSDVGADMLKKISIYEDLAEIIRYHHARYDGKGYPRTSSPDEIPMLSHIMAVADAFDAMTSNRIYRPVKSVKEALNELIDLKSQQFHPDVVDAALIALKDVNIGSTSQMPISLLEQRRMSYFFQDSLTGLYNEDYLQMILNGIEHPYKSLDIISLHDFSNYNNSHSWEEGNVLLQNISNHLESYYPESMIVRFHGDDFIILTKHTHDIDLLTKPINKLLQETEVTLKVFSYDIDEKFTFNSLKKLF